MKSGAALPREDDERKRKEEDGRKNEHRHALQDLCAQLEQLARDASSTLIVPANLSDISSMIGVATSVLRNQQSGAGAITATSWGTLASVSTWKWARRIRPLATIVATTDPADVPMTRSASLTRTPRSSRVRR